MWFRGMKCQIVFLALPILLFGMSYAINQFDCITNTEDSTAACATCLLDNFIAYTGNAGQIPKVNIPQGYYASMAPHEGYVNSTTDEIQYYTQYYYSDTYGGSLFKYEYVDIGLSVSSMNEIDDVENTMTLSGLMALHWADIRLQWNETLAPCFHSDDGTGQAGYLPVPLEWIWTPNIILANGEILDSQEGTARVYSNGHVEVSIPIVFTITCLLDLKLYPFDTQTCPIVFQSQVYKGDGIILKEKACPDLSTNYHSTSDWDTLRIETVGVGGEGVIKYGDIDSFKYSTYSVQMIVRRYNAYYYTTALIPDLVVTTIAILGLWVKDYPSRVGIEMTLLLTVMAILWSISSNIPSTATTTWLSSFTEACMFLTGMCTAASCVSFSISMMTRDVPHFIVTTLFILNALTSKTKYYTSVFTSEETDEAATLLEKFHGQGYGIGIVVPSIFKKPEAGDSTEDALKQGEQGEVKIEQGQEEGQVIDEVELTLIENPSLPPPHAPSTAIECEEEEELRAHHFNKLWCLLARYFDFLVQLSVTFTFAILMITFYMEVNP